MLGKYSLRTFPPECVNRVCDVTLNTGSSRGLRPYMRHEIRKLSAEEVIKDGLFPVSIFAFFSAHEKTSQCALLACLLGDLLDFSNLTFL